MTLTEHLTKYKDAAGRPLEFSTLADFIKFARTIDGDAFATESEAATLIEVREHGFEVVKGYIHAGLVTILDLTDDERDLALPYGTETAAYEALAAAFDRYVAIYGVNAAVEKVRAQAIEFGVNLGAGKDKFPGTWQDRTI